MMPSQESSDVPLFGSFYPLMVGGDGEDSSLKRGKECTLMLKHSKGQVTSTLQSTKLTSSLPHPGPSSSPSKKQRRKTNKKKKLEPLPISNAWWRIRDRPPVASCAAKTSPTFSTLTQSPGPSEKQFKCDQCDLSSKSLRGLKVHNGRSHKDSQLPEQLLLESFSPESPEGGGPFSGCTPISFKTKTVADFSSTEKECPARERKRSSQVQKL